MRISDWSSDVCSSDLGFGHGRQVHGGHAVPLYYGEGLRTAWYGLKPGMHVNREPGDQVNEFDSIFVILAGAVRARLDGREATLRKGESEFVPAGIAHEFCDRKRVV